MSITYEHEEKDNACGDISLRIVCEEREVTIENSSGRTCSLEYEQIAILNEAVRKYQAMKELANG